MTGKNHQFITGWFVIASTVIFAAAALISRASIRGASEETLVGKSVSPIQVSAEWSQEWHEKEGTIALMRGICRIVQGGTTYTAESMVIWAHESEGSPGLIEQLIVYLEGDVRIDESTSSRNLESHWVELDATRGITLSVRGRATDKPGLDDPLFKRALQRKFGSNRSKLRQTQLTVPSSSAPDSSWRTVPVQSPAGIKRVRVSPRSFSSAYNISSQLSTDTTPPEQVTLITGGVNILVEGVQYGGTDFGVIDLSADRVVIWTEDFTETQPLSPDQKYQVYLEGNIVIRQRDSVRQLNNVIRASRAFYDAQNFKALILDAELETYISKLDSSIRLRADRIRQNSEKNYHAQNAWITTSQYGVPGYRFQSSDIFLENRETGLFADKEPPRVDPNTGIVIPKDHYWVTALNSQFLVDQFPVFNVPRVSIPAEDVSTSGTPLQGGGFGIDRVFGTQVRTTWDVFSLLGIKQPDNPRVKLGVQADYFSLRGPATGLLGKYDGTDDFGNAYAGNLSAYYINDHGTDNLGLDRRALIPPSDNRGLFQWDQRYNLDDYRAQLFGEIGYVSDRNFQEQYREHQFDTGKDVETKVQWNQAIDENSAYTLLGRPTLNYFENNTAWLPKGDLYFLGEPIINNFVNYSSHSSLGYGVMNMAAPPTDPSEVYTPLPYMNNESGIVAQTRHQLEVPFNLGELKVAPFILGEAAYWGSSLIGDPISRLYGRAGVRASINFQRVFPLVHSDIFNLNGLAHKSLIEAEYGIAGTTHSYTDIAQYNEMDDNAQERFRMRLVQDTYGGMLPIQVDPRFYAIRAGAGATVTAPYSELVGNQQVLRLNWHQRLQTKVGPPDLQRVKDWMTLDLGASIFPDANRDNFGQTVGLVNSRFAWNVGDRTSILASSLYDFFANGEQLWSVGVVNQRGLRGSVYFGVRQVKAGVLDSQIATCSYSYVLSPKWVSTGATAFDMAQARSAGQSFTMTRVGEWLLVHMGFNVDTSKNNVGIGITIEPRIGGGKGLTSSTQLGSLLNLAQPQY